MVIFLVLDVTNHPLHLVFAVGEGTIPCLPCKLSSNQPIVVDPFGGVLLDLFHQIG